eukprot:m.264210 g.264210  ORF g.264210 m.264210 type:complete len:131 (+) comp11053_c2_seq18:412-804(+)
MVLDCSSQDECACSCFHPALTQPCRSPSDEQPHVLTANLVVDAVTSVSQELLVFSRESHFSQSTSTRLVPSAHAMPCFKGFLLRSLAPTQLKTKPKAATWRAQCTVPAIDLHIAAGQSSLSTHVLPAAGR